MTCPAQLDHKKSPRPCLRSKGTRATYALHSRGTTPVAFHLHLMLWRYLIFVDTLRHSIGTWVEDHFFLVQTLCGNQPPGLLASLIKERLSSASRSRRGSEEAFLCQALTNFPARCRPPSSYYLRSTRTDSIHLLYVRITADERIVNQEKAEATRPRGKTGKRRGAMNCAC